MGQEWLNGYWVSCGRVDVYYLWVQDGEARFMTVNEFTYLFVTCVVLMALWIVFAPER